MVSSAEISQGWSVRVSGGCRRADVDVVVVVVVELFDGVEDTD